MSTVKGFPESEANWNALIPAKGTPMKFTRSLAAKAIANAKVPISTMGLRMLSFVKIESNWKIKPKNRKFRKSIVQECVLIQVMVSVDRKEVPLAPLIRIKYMIMFIIPFLFTE